MFYAIKRMCDSNLKAIDSYMLFTTHSRHSILFFSFFFVLRNSQDVPEKEEGESFFREFNDL
jgi:hypothetical protein